MKNVFILCFSLVLFNLIKAQSTDVVAPSAEIKDRGFAVGLGFRLNSPFALFYSPVIKFQGENNFVFYTGPSFLINLDNIKRTYKFSFRIGMEYVFKNKKNNHWEEFIKMEINKAEFKYKSISYDYAYPNIPIKATIVHDHKFVDYSLNFGLRYRFMKKYYLGVDGGVRLIREIFLDPDIYTEETRRYNVLPAFSLEAGVNF